MKEENLNHIEYNNEKFKERNKKISFRKKDIYKSILFSFLFKCIQSFSVVNKVGGCTVVFQNLYFEKTAKN